MLIFSETDICASLIVRAEKVMQNKCKTTTWITKLTQSLDVTETCVWLDRRRGVSRTDALAAKVIRLRERLQ